ncbi:uncharacterized protein HD556DRAFT_1247928 [Suillus plorans]|uniref:Helix-turn-helix domain-containing protein n=1 Tax=Suillus plorans TaxID=116603 RepID=A0A9P7ACW0_9AGAM|nr:uncharacterized protein HD556DRAFT_1247928 [Suillus plorans]KAG1786704.1 hypothetical protein HD556DRAFT_1247928 [Suillus plorans]
MIVHHIWKVLCILRCRKPPTCPFGRKLATVNLYDNGILSLEQILECVGFSKRTFWQILRPWRENGVQRA